MKKVNLIISLLVMLFTSIENVWGTDVTVNRSTIGDLDNEANGASGIITKTVSVTNDLTINYVGVNTQSAPNKQGKVTPYDYIMFISGKGYMYNSTAPSGYYPSNIVVTFSSGTGTKGTVGISYGTTTLSSINASVSGAVAQGGTCTLSNDDPAKKYWNFSTKGANVEVASIVITYTSTGGSTYSVVIASTHLSARNHLSINRFYSIYFYFTMSKIILEDFSSFVSIRQANGRCQFTISQLQEVLRSILGLTVALVRPNCPLCVP